MDAFERKEYDRVVELTLPYAIAGNSDAQTQLSLLYQLGLGVKRDVLEAERLRPDRRGEVHAGKDDQERQQASTNVQAIAGSASMHR